MSKHNSRLGFMKGRSCLTNLLEFTEIISKWLPVDVIYLDFQKAFDKVPHQRLLIKLRAHAMGDIIVNWVSNWLTDRKQSDSRRGQIVMDNST